MAEKIEIMKVGGKILDQAMRYAAGQTQPGMSLFDINQMFETKVSQAGGYPGFKTVANYQWGTCINVNSGLVHGIPHKSVYVKLGDVITIDGGVLYQDYHTDKAATFKLTADGPDYSLPFLQAGIKSLRSTLKKVGPNVSLKEISRSIQSQIFSYGYKIIPELGGHGIGHQLHQEPMILQYVQSGYKYSKLTPGQTIAIEIIYAQGDPEMKENQDGWTLETADGKLGGMYEETVAVVENGFLILTAENLEATCLQ